MAAYGLLAAQPILAMRPFASLLAVAGAMQTVVSELGRSAGKLLAGLRQSCSLYASEKPAHLFQGQQGHQILHSPCMTRCRRKNALAHEVDLFGRRCPHQPIGVLQLAPPAPAPAVKHPGAVDHMDFASVAVGWHWPQLAEPNFYYQADLAASCGGAPRALASARSSPRAASAQMSSCGPAVVSAPLALAAGHWRRLGCWPGQRCPEPWPLPVTAQLGVQSLLSHCFA